MGFILTPLRTAFRQIVHARFLALPFKANDCSRPPPKLDRLSGLVERVTYHNGENGFCVLRLKVKGERELVTLIYLITGALILLLVMFVTLRFFEQRELRYKRQCGTTRKRPLAGKACELNLELSKLLPLTYAHTEKW